MGRHVLRFLTIHTLAGRKRDPVVYLMKPPKANGASVTHDITRTLGGGCIHVDLNNIQSRTRVQKREEACINSVPKQVIGNLERTNIGGPLVLLSRISGISDSCGKSATSTLLRILSTRRGHGFHSRCIRVPVSLSRILFIIATGAARAVPHPLLSHVRIVRIDDCATTRGFRVTQRRLVPGRLGGGNVRKQLVIDSGTLHDIVRNCAERTNIENLRQGLKRVYQGTTERLLGRSGDYVHIGSQGLRGCLNGPEFRSLGTGRASRVKVIHNLT